MIFIQDTHPDAELHLKKSINEWGQKAPVNGVKVNGVKVEWHGIKQTFVENEEVAKRVESSATLLDAKGIQMMRPCQKP